MPDADVLKRSVTRDDLPKSPQDNAVFFFMLAAPQYTPRAPELPAYWGPGRDYVLRGTLHVESMWASAVYKAVTKQAALGWKVDDKTESAVRTKRAQDLLLGAGRGWTQFISQHLQDWLLTDNGVFVEVIRATSAAGSRILGLQHLDSARCRRTGDPEIPVIYRDRKGREHELRWYQVLAGSDMPSASDTYYGVGFCAASRAYSTISKLAGMEQYVDEKVKGSRALAIHFVNGVSDKQLQAAVGTAEQAAAAKGAVAYRGALVVPIMGDVAPQVVTVPLAELPDGFDAEQERTNAYLIYANAIGVAVQDIQPLSGQGLGTGTQTVILDEAAEGQGLAAWRKWWEQTINDDVLPESTTFAFATNDIRDQKATAEVSKVRAETRKVQIEAGEITPEQALNMAVDAGDAPREFLPQDGDATPGGSLGDTEKPVTGEEAAAAGGNGSVAEVSAAAARVRQALGLKAEGFEPRGRGSLPPVPERVVIREEDIERALDIWDATMPELAGLLDAAVVGDENEDETD